MFQLLLDTADVKKIAEINEYLPVAGVTTNPSIMAGAGTGVNFVLPAIVEVLGEDTQLFVQALSTTVDGIVEEAHKLSEMPYKNLTVKIPTTPIGLAAMKKLRSTNIRTLATAIYTVQQGFLAALNGADFMSPYVNRIDTLNNDGVGVCAEIQHLLNVHDLPTILTPASFKSTQQVLDCLATGCGAITLPVDVIEQMVNFPAVQPAVAKFNKDWSAAFGDKLSYNS
ncbi:transaldolase family protein [Methyloprofundus sp.]|uniref:transaldolase family protein n=1 Tax=Methyloprofundus sp. TaxID=2020875 RepID=UPI003D0D4B06